MYYKKIEIIQYIYMLLINNKPGFWTMPLSELQRAMFGSNEGQRTTQGPLFRRTREKDDLTVTGRPKSKKQKLIVVEEKTVTTTTTIKTTTFVMLHPEDLHKANELFEQDMERDAEYTGSDISLSPTQELGPRLRKRKAEAGALGPPTKLF